MSSNHDVDIGYMLGRLKDYSADICKIFNFPEMDPSIVLISEIIEEAINIVKNKKRIVNEEIYNECMLIKDLNISIVDIKQLITLKETIGRFCNDSK